MPDNGGKMLTGTQGGPEGGRSAPKEPLLTLAGLACRWGQRAHLPALPERGCAQGGGGLGKAGQTETLSQR